MALAIQSSCPLKRPSVHHPSTIHIFPTKTRFTVRATESSSGDSEPTNGGTQLESSSVLTPPKKSNKTGVGFGSSSSTETKDNKKKPRSRERATIVRRSPLQKPSFLSNKKEAQITQEQSRNESAFLLTWLGLGSLILIEGIALSASGFLPEEWDKLFVKYLYPSFTPTVFLFVAGTTVYGVLKYLQGEKTKG
ncbi:hypothetical protein BVC80_9051g20 [Macleaya cordata]|uniref:Protein LOW PSII ACCUMULATION 2, chloroplastic n=1 Tax=Macleaya cordata TaxID=56857 RepID=A0A200R9W8_MACCD|nr:hypothetical protein BVC80_9051g20 [Macleaya cordata]